MSEKDKAESEKPKTETPAIRDLQKDEIDSVSGGAGSKAPELDPWTDPDPKPIYDPKGPRI